MAASRGISTGFARGGASFLFCSSRATCCSTWASISSGPTPGIERRHSFELRWISCRIQANPGRFGDRFR